MSLQIECLPRTFWEIDFFARTFDEEEFAARGLALVADTYDEPMVVSLHPRTADTHRVARFGLDPRSERVPLRGSRRSACSILWNWKSTRTAF